MVDSSDQKTQREGTSLFLKIFSMETEARANLLEPKLLKGMQKWFFEMSDEELAKYE